MFEDQLYTEIAKQIAKGDINLLKSLSDSDKTIILSKLSPETILGYSSYNIL